MLPDNETLVALMKRAAAGSEAAFSDIVRYFEKTVYNLSMQAVRNREDALDVSQEVFLKLWRTAGSYRGECSVNSWIIRITRNTSLDLLRRRSARPTESLTLRADDGCGERGEEGAEREIPSGGVEEDPVASYERRERIEAVRCAISELGEEHREIIVLRDIEGMSYAEIGEALGLEAGTVKSRLYRARNTLKEILQKRNII